jgi:hypothetical protein
MLEVEEGFNRLVQRIPTFRILDPTLVPEGLKPHTRSICWLMEQVILQNTRQDASYFGFSDFEYPESDVSVWDAKFKLIEVQEAGKIFVNVKVGNATIPDENNDFASIKALLSFYEKERDPLLLCVVFKFRFANVQVTFDGRPLVKNYTWVDNFVVNPRNKHLQALYNCGQTPRTTQQFVAEVRRKAIEKGVINPVRTL